MNRGEKRQAGSGCWLLIGSRRTHVLANVLNLKDRSMPCPSAVSVHLLSRSPSSSFVRCGSSEPSANFGAAAMAADLENDLVGTVGFRCGNDLDAGLRMLSAFIVV